MEKYLQVGVITSTHGVRGEVKVYPTTDDLNRFKKLKSCILEPDKLNMALHITGVRFHNNMAIIKFDEFNSPEEAAKYKTKGIFVTRDQAVPLEEDEYFITDLIGLDVKLKDGTDFGILTEVMQTGANDVYCIDHNGVEVLIPAIKQCVLDVDMGAGLMTIDLMDGLI